ncbi:MAG: branched-chain amino acid aminotransferase, partial [Desulfomonilaceae bacterium]
PSLSYIEKFAAMDGNEATLEEATKSLYRSELRYGIMDVGPYKGMKVSERVISIDDLVSAANAGALQEVFGSGTAAVISPVSHFRYLGHDYMVADGKTGKVAKELFDEITGIQLGTRPDPYGWVVNVG